ncbi:hypothetical protein GCM10029964_047410 [Kibdelosporangium lantanae]
MAGLPGVLPRAADQGVGRALWFIHAANPAQVAAAVDRFAPHRRADLWSGVGLAATFAGGCPADDLAVLRRAAGEHRAEVALGMVFAVKARVHAGHTPTHAEQAAAVLGDLTVAGAVELADGTAVHEGGTATAPAYELWRQKIRAHFASLPA